MANKKIVFLILVVLLLTVGAANLLVQKHGGEEGYEEVIPESEPEGSITEPEEQETGLTVDREAEIPEHAVKVTPETDPYPPILHSALWEEPVPMPPAINTAGGEDSPFITPCGCEFFFFFTPDPLVPAEGQIIDGVTGIYYSKKTEEGWSEAKRLLLIEEGISLDGCPWVGEGEIWWCSVRKGNMREIDIWKADLEDGNVTNIRHGGERLNVEVGIGEFHITADGNEIYFHSDVPGGKGGRDIWVTRKVDGEWQDPENVEEVNTDGSDSLPFVTQDGEEMWFTRWYMGYPAIYMSRKVDGCWSEPELIISQFAAEPTLDAEGNIYFAHHFIQDGIMLDADIYVAYKRKPIEPLDSEVLPPRGFYMGVLPTPAEGQSFDEAYQQASQSVEIVPIWGRPTPFYQLANELNGSWGDTFVDALTRRNGLKPLIHLSFMDAGLTLKIPPGLEGATLSDPDWRQAYKNAVLETVIVSRPLYLSVGNEVNRWYEKYGLESPNGFEHWVSLYEEIYNDVKELSLETQVFCTFSREIVSEYREADLDVLTLFDPDKLDLLVITSYPFSLQGVNRPEDIPDDYYTRASDYMPGLAFGFSEIAWSSMEAFGGEQGQADFLRDVTSRLTVDQGIELRLLSWSWLHDLGKDDDTGLIENDGEEKEAYEVWLAISSEGR